jgi:gamma-glutamyl hercynylcysteine S-oxide hydrolase
MCRHLAYLGPPVTLRSVLIDPPCGLYKQSWAPRFQRPGAINADGFGVGWYSSDVGDPGDLADPGHLTDPGDLADPEPARYRQAVPIWADQSFADLARVTRTGALLAMVRNATPGTSHGPAAVGPFRHGRWLFTHNGVLDGWPSSTAGIAATLPTVALLELEARVDSALSWALVLHRLRAGLAPAAALADTIGALHTAGVTGNFNFLLTDGHEIAATAAGHTLYYREAGGSVTVASEPADDEPGWLVVPGGSLVTAVPGQVSVTPLPAAPHLSVPSLSAPHLSVPDPTPDGRITIP